jgi:ligand-binding sensor domain-containing protein
LFKLKIGIVVYVVFLKSMTDNQGCISLSYRLIVMLVFLCQGSVTFAQHNQVETFTFSDGMAMTECGGLHCDRSGMIWAQHSTGWVSRFDGRHFTRYSPAEIGIQSDGGQFIEDRLGLWLQKNNTIALFRDETWTSWDLPGANRSILDKASNQIIVVDRDYNLWKLDTAISEWIQYSQLPTNDLGGESLVIASREENKYLLLQFPSFKNWEPTKAFTCNSLLHPSWKEDPQYLRPGKEWAFHHISHSMGEIIELDIPAIEPDMKFNFLTTSRSRILFAMSKQDPVNHRFKMNIYATDHHNTIHFLATFLVGHANIGLAIDSMGNVWASSHSGLHRIHTSIVECFDSNPNMVPSVHVINEDDQGRIWFGGYTSGSAYYEHGQIHPATGLASRYKSFLPGAYRDAMGNMAFWTEDYWLTTYENNNTWRDALTVLPDQPRVTGYCFLALQNQHVAAGMQSKGIGLTPLPLRADSKWTFISKQKGMRLDNVLTLAEDTQGRLWAGRTSQGVAVYDPVLDTAQTWLMEEDTARHFGVISAVIDPAGRLWMGCMDGLRVLEHPDSFRLFTDDFPAMVNKIIMDEAGYNLAASLAVNNNYIVFGNQNGYGFVDLASYAQNPQRPRIFFFSSHEFGESAEQNAIMVDTKGYLWIGQDKGATRINMDGFILDSTPVVLTAQKVIIKEHDGHTSEFPFRTDHTVRLPVNKRSITIPIQLSYTGFLTDNVGLQYRLVHSQIEDTLWSSYTRNFEVRLDYLPPGKNILQVRAIKNNQIVYQTAYTVHLPRTVFESFIFWLGIFTALSLVGFIVTQRIYRQRLHLKLAQINLAEQQREKNQFQISAIANALNPHFIKNTLMWMQSRFRKDEQVTDVIDRLAYNISAVFTQSRKGQAFHSLAEEMKVTENFLAIQVSTYGAFLQVTLPQPAEWQVWKNLAVPLLQLQIHVENAIEHGLRPKADGQRILTMTFAEEDHFIVAMITDNGIGRKMAKARGSRGSGQGTNMLHRIYELFNQQNEFHFSSTYEDLVDKETGVATGTVVRIRIPKQYNTQL